MNKILFITLLFLFINISLAKRRSYLTNTDASIAFTEYGAIKGLVRDTHRVFYGIPFAQPPEGRLRWEVPIDPIPWTNIKETTTQKKQCAQRCNLGPGVCSSIGTSEDCLYLDVFTPKDANPDSNLPVIVYCPGGAFTVGTGAVPLYDGTKFAQSNVILVNINYRLGTFGFLRTDLIPGNYGFLDQVKALEWVNKNIAAFGGNKNKVTLWGESAGAFSVATHLTSTYSRQYFHAAISFSSPLTIGLKDKATARGFSEKFIDNIGCKRDDLSCLRGKSMEEVLDAQETVRPGLTDSPLDAFTIWSPVIDEVIIPMQPLVAAKLGKAYDVPTIIGNVKDEAIQFVYAFSQSIIKPLEYRFLVSIVFPLQQSNILPLYPAAPIGQDCRPILSELMNDYLFRCQDRYYLNRFVDHHNSPVYHYNYVHVKSTEHAFEPCDGKSCHGNELSLFFNTYEKMNENLTPDERELAEDLNNYIVNFATNHNPNTGLPVPVNWPAVTKTRNSTLIIDVDPVVRDVTTNDARCDALDLTYYRNQVRP
ncbi:hypothetical protein DICPUDRAFT_91822 [Dictyostelium purpureum]|uniref:Carboxylic ester hydrolase n=1 Tax=Dictyostelium purpureum TaxID=5786 RepID=F0ZHT1_DICPU|nr:uncharacterized protein DICPUDRAFT_91822 [Dictyostelium purpureum]EGC36530.1 hypothetical protein DICPUDRAFT_91822 [Dictyostelium purpureum]|eukprot:XP_003286975.1 hypothetical protein DICPUDRAFT_91822 [Dictyostelium purpureum]